MVEDFFTLLAFLPAVLILYFFYKQDKNRKEPRGTIAKFFFAGFIVAILAGFLNGIVIKFIFGSVNFVPSTVVNSFKFGFIPGFVEESLKIICVLLLVYGLKKFDERADGIFYTVTVGMGFAAIENFTYVISLSAQGYGLQIAFMRALSAVPMHAIVGAIMGYFIGKAKFFEVKVRAPLFLAGWFGAVLIHGTYNSTLAAAFVAKNMGLALVPVFLLIGGVTIAIILMKKLVKEDKMSIDFSAQGQSQVYSQQSGVQQANSQIFSQDQSSLPSNQQEQRTVYCSNCGEKLVEGAAFCPNCGSKTK